MEVKLALLADYANITKEGKVNIMGVFGRMFAQAFPTQLVNFQFVIQVEGHSIEALEEHLLSIRFRNEDGKDIIPPIEAKIPITVVEDPSKPYAVNHMIQIQGLPIPLPGDYEFVISIDGKVERTVDLSIVALGGDTPGQNRLSGT